MKPIISSVVGLAILSPLAHAATGFSNGRLYFVTSLNGGGNVYNQVVTGTTPGTGAESGHDLSSDGFNPTFSNFGTLGLSDILVVKGFEYKTYENNSSDVTHGNLYYRVYDTGSPSGSWNQIIDSNNNDDVWTVTNGTTNILSGLSEGDYTIEIYTESYTNGVNSAGNIFGFSGGGNPTASFTLIPEPSAALLGGLGVLALLRRRRA